MLTLPTSYCLGMITSVGEVNFKWKKKSIKVCWQDNRPLQMNDFHQSDYLRISEYLKTSYTIKNELKKKIQGHVEEEFQTEVTGIHFVGWKECENGDQSDAIIIVGKSLKNYIDGEASIGQSVFCKEDKVFLLRSSNQKAFVYLNISRMTHYKDALSEDERIKILALHEFGHLAGLRHEDIRKTSQITELTTDGTQIFSSYDHNSIMSYEFIHSILTKTGNHFYTISDNHLRLEWMTLYPDRNVVMIGILWPYLRDKRQFYHSQKISKSVTEHFVHLGLSGLDVHGLRCLYVYDIITYSKKCRNP